MADSCPGLERLFAIEPREEAYRIDADGEPIPAWLRGTYYANGPGLFQRGNVAYRNWLDGDGQVVALRFTDSGVFFTSRFVRSRKWAQEEEAGGPIFRTFGTSFPGDRLRRGIGLESPVNVSVFRWGGKLLAFGEQGLPWQLDPGTLETRGEHDFERALNEVSPFAAHPRFDPVRGEMVCFGVSYDPRRPRIHLYRFDPTGRLTSRFRIELPYPCTIHDFGLSENHAVFHVSPYLVDIGAFLEGGRSLIEALSWQPERGSGLLVVARANGQTVARFELPPRYCLHHINAFERDDRLNVDLIELERPVYSDYQPLDDLLAEVPLGRPVRLTLTLEGRAELERRELDYAEAPDFPALDPRLWSQSYEEFWLLGISSAGQSGRKLYDELLQLDWRQAKPASVYRAPRGEVLGTQPVLLPAPGGQDQDLVICQQVDPLTGRGDFGLFSARDLEAGPRTTLPLRSPLRLGFHASFYPETAHQGETSESGL